MGSLPDGLRARVRRSPFALDAATASYRPPGTLAAYLHDLDREPFLVRMGRGRSGSPELYAGGPGYLITAGGSAPPGTRGIAVRPIVLLLADGVHDRDDCFHIPTGRNGPRRANRTGVAYRFACGDAPVRVPAHATPEAECGGWRIYRPLPGRPLRVAVYNREAFGLLAVFPEHSGSAKALIDSLRAANRGKDLARSFTFPDENYTLTYNPRAPRTLWVMETAGGNVLDRNFRSWPRLAGEVRDPQRPCVVESLPLSDAFSCLMISSASSGYSSRRQSGHKP